MKDTGQSNDQNQFTSFDFNSTFSDFYVVYNDFIFKFDISTGVCL